MLKIKTYLLLTLVCAFFCSLEVSATEYTIEGITRYPVVELKGTTSDVITQTVTIGDVDLSSYTIFVMDDAGKKLTLTSPPLSFRDKLASSSSNSNETVDNKRYIVSNGSFSVRKSVIGLKLLNSNTTTYTTKVTITFYPNENYRREVYTVGLGVKTDIGWSSSDPAYHIPLVLNNYDAATAKSYSYAAMEYSNLILSNFYLATVRDEISGGSSKLDPLVKTKYYSVVSGVRTDYALFYMSPEATSGNLTEGQFFHLDRYTEGVNENEQQTNNVLSYINSNGEKIYPYIGKNEEGNDVMKFTKTGPTNYSQSMPYFTIDESDNTIHTNSTANRFYLAIKNGAIFAKSESDLTNESLTKAQFYFFNRLENESAEYNQLKVLRPANGATSTLNLASNNADDYFTFDVTFDYPVAHDQAGNVLDMYGRKLMDNSDDGGSDLMDIWVDFTETDATQTNEAPKDRGLLKIKRGSLAGASVNVQAAPNTVQFTMNVGAMCDELAAASSSTNNAPMMKVMGPRKIKRGSLAGASVNVQMAPGAVGNAEVAFATLPAASSAPRMGLMRTNTQTEYADLVSPKLGVTYNIENSGYGQTEVPVNSYGLSTFYTEDPLSVNLNDEVKFYKVKSTDADGTINLERVTGIVKGPFMVAGTTTCLYNSNSQATTTESTSYPKLSVAKPGETIKSTNTISGTLLGKPISITMYSYLYGRMNASDPTPAFHKLNVDRVLPSDVNDAKYKPWVVYLQTKTKINPTSGSPIIVKLYEGIEQEGDEPEATYIYMVGDDGEGRLVPVSDENVYNVMGQKVSANYNGVVIRKGKKVFNGKN